VGEQFGDVFDMHLLLLLLAILNLAVVLATAVQLSISHRSIGKLADQPPLPDDGGHLPKVSLVVPARNEEKHLESAMRSLLSLDYRPLEIIAVDDRSTDRTGEILDRMAASDPRLRVVHLTELPPKWLGKNYALHRGAEHADGEWLLFTDADVLFDPSALKRAMTYLQRNQLDHLAITPYPCMPSWLLQSFVVMFAMYFSLFTQMRKVRDPRSSAHIGIGAFNLIRSSAYREVGGHVGIAMRPDDDLKLGKQLKKKGFRQDVLHGGELLRVEWYSTLGETIVGLEKNLFAGVEYSVTATVTATMAICVFHIWPFIAPAFTTGATRWIYVAVAAILLSLSCSAAVGIKLRKSCGFGFPLVAAIFVYISWRSMLLALWNRGIRWRDTHYPLAELRANRV
jgi:glycosyltransferase involved in cell wall biosynthesis